MAFKAASGGGGGGSVVNPSISPVSGAYTSPQTITVPDSTSGATICVRTDGGTPTANTPGTCDSPAIGYSSGSNFALTIPSSGATVNALGTLSGDTNSNVTTNNYTLSGGSGPSVYYYIEDSLGTSRFITDSSGNLCYDADFYPFGGERAYTTNCSQNYKFTGKERDPESNLDNFGARYDSSSTGRFMSPDPMGNYYADGAYPQSWNLYTYVRNNPLSSIDPNGLDCVYLDDMGNMGPRSSVDHNSNPGECDIHWRNLAQLDCQ